MHCSCFQGSPESEFHLVTVHRNGFDSDSEFLQGRSASSARPFKLNNISYDAIFRVNNVHDFCGPAPVILSEDCVACCGEKLFVCVCVCVSLAWCVCNVFWVCRYTVCIYVCVCLCVYDAWDVHVTLREDSRRVGHAAPLMTGGTAWIYGYMHTYTCIYICIY
jgi:hypothetical protein